MFVSLFEKRKKYVFRSSCRSLSGTSVASPVVAGAVTLLIRFVDLCLCLDDFCKSDVNSDYLLDQQQSVSTSA